MLQKQDIYIENLLVLAKEVRRTNKNTGAKGDEQANANGSDSSYDTAVYIVQLDDQLKLLKIENAGFKKDYLKSKLC